MFGCNRKYDYRLGGQRADTRDKTQYKAVSFLVQLSREIVRRTIDQEMIVFAERNEIKSSMPSKIQVLEQFLPKESLYLKLIPF